MKKNLTILICYLSISQFTQPASAAPQLAAVIDLVADLQQAQSKNILERLRGISHYLQSDYKTGAAQSKEIAEARAEIAKATALIPALYESYRTKSLNSLAVYTALQKVDYTFLGDQALTTTSNSAPQLFAIYALQRCYNPIVESNLTKQALQIKDIKINPALVTKDTSEAILQDQSKLQVVEILQKIEALWAAANLLFQNQDPISLQIPKTTLKITDWIKLTQNAAQSLFNTTQVGQEHAAKLKDVQAAEAKGRKDITTEQAASLKTINPMTRAQQLEKMHEFYTQKTTDQQALEKELEKMKAQVTKELKILQAQEKTQSEHLMISAQKLDMTQKIIDSFNKCRATHTLNHELFTTQNVPAKIDAALTNLQTITANMKDFGSEKYVDIMKARMLFIDQMNSLYSCLFKQNWGGILNQFLVIKHQFKDKPDGTKISQLSAAQAIDALTSLIILWEIYSILFEKMDSPTTEDQEPQAHTIKLNYFEMQAPVSDWIAYTKEAGFNKKAQFSSTNSDSQEPSALDVALTTCLPAEEVTASSYKLWLLPSKMIASVKNATYATGRSLQNATYAAGRTIRNATYSTSGKIKKVFMNFTSSVENELDDLFPTKSATVVPVATPVSAAKTPTTSAPDETDPLALSTSSITTPPSGSPSPSGSAVVPSLEPNPLYESSLSRSSATSTPTAAQAPALPKSSAAPVATS